MFRGGQPNAYDEIVAKTTDENLTGENWELILNLCDKVQEEGEQGAHNVIGAAMKRLAHRNPNVQLYTLAMVEALSKNCGIEVHREIASRAFTQALEKLVTDRTIHDKVRKRVLTMVMTWTAEFEKDPTLGLMEECYENLKSKGYKFETPNEPPPPDVDDEVRRREEEELQRALEISMQDKGGRSQWEGYSLASSSGASGSGAGSSRQGPSTTPGPSSSARPSQSSPAPTYGGYVPSSATPAVSAVPQPTRTPVPAAAPATSRSPVSSIHSTSDSIPIVTRVRALHTFEPTEPGELAFEKGEIIKVVDRNYKDWWRGQLKGRTGIFPVNYVEPLPEPTAAEITREAEQEAAVFSQAANVDKLLTMLRTMDPARDNLADNEEIQELYRSCMSLRPKIVKLIDKYSQKRADLVSMNETFVKARTIFDRMMEDSLARHTGVYDNRPPYMQTPSQSYIPRPDSRAPQEYYPPGGPPAAPGAPQAYGWNPTLYEQPGYHAYPAAPAAYPPENPYPAPGQGQPQLPAQPQAYGDPNAYAPHPQSGFGQPPIQPYPGSTPYPPAQEPQGYPTSPGAQPPMQQQPFQPQQLQQPIQPHQGFQPQPQPQQTPQAQQPQQSVQPQLYPQASVQPELQPQPQPQLQPQAQAQPEAQPQPQPQPQPQTQPQVQQQTQPQIQAQQTFSPAPQQPSGGPPYVYDPNATYPEPNAQAWAQYYAHGGTDPTGAVYFISVPGVKEGPAAPTGPSRNPSTDSVGQATVAGEQQGQVAPLHIHKQSVADGQGAPQSQVALGQPGTYGASPYAPEGLAASAGAAAGQPAVGQQFYGLSNQFAGMEINGGGDQHNQTGPQGVGAPA
ncbi:hypothetical protein C2E23DRAFT_837847 [Lenzites betulinus]|nr:hypothetical protein C2E23DRAFT_837847 [Lenzites betulinus]